MNREQVEKLRLDKRNWKLGVIYSCKDDPRVIVRNLWIFGWAWNFGNSLVFIVLPLFVAIFLAPILLFAIVFNASVFVLMTVSSITLLILVALANYIAQGPR